MKITMEGKVSCLMLDNKGRVTADVRVRDYRYNGETDSLHIDGTNLELGQKVTVVVHDDVHDSIGE
jgi:hypothetical protein